MTSTSTGRLRKATIGLPREAAMCCRSTWPSSSGKSMARGENFVRPGDVVLDCGANIGVFVREALDAGAKTVVAIEPAPENIECLRRNFKSDIDAGRVIVYPKGVWDKDDFLTLHVDDHNSAADSFVINPKDSHESDQKLPLTTIDKLVAELNLQSVDFIKMDIEGAEVKALKGGRRRSRSITRGWGCPSITRRIIRWKFRRLRRKHGPATRSSVVRVRLPMAKFGRIFCISISLACCGGGSILFGRRACRGCESIRHLPLLIVPFRGICRR